MNVLLTAHGSRGDVYPMIALGREFVRKGHRVSMLTQILYKERLEESGIEGIFLTEDMQAEMSSMGSDWKSIRRMMDWSRRCLEEEFDLLEEVSGEADLVVCTNQEFSVASIAEWRNLPAYRLSYIPAIPGDHTPPLIPWQDLPTPVNRLIWKAFGAGLDSMSKKTVNAWRNARGLDSVKSLTPHMTSVFLTLYGFNSMLAPPHPSWPASAFRYCGYCFEDDEDVLPPELETFLRAGEKPVYFGFGSVSVPDPDKTTRIALDAAFEADCRLVIGRGWTGLGSPEVLSEKPGWATPDRVCVVDEVSHTLLFPRTAGVCHHGGAGTTHRAARAGVPQCIMPMFIDQHFWGRKVHKLGAGPAPISPKRMNAANLAGIFRSFAKTESWNAGAADLAASMAEEGGTPAAYETIMKHLDGRRAGAA